ncbi:hypothetical protein [Neisseria wadsworthii]|uniref:Uncharacterized protein n=1 Tax=Neisseria wadsworthii 9715 TaxID=1030841 RepID=G4CPU6_9NEIS|nr:hypothetical protein [Neisseria wadsworthii]EGZ47453.1 hypothetical protein HMPREF9370_1106 [Neisseria wadsworthii 9715]QMT34890.1 hypothetical protein H3L96_07335 [Neisseria wadsworthii]
MSKYAIPLLFLFLTFDAHAFEQERLERACRIEQGSLLKDRNGTPSCDELKRFHAKKSIKSAKNNNHSAKAPKASKPKKIANGEGAGYRWNPHEGRFCQHNAKGFAQSCY